jgi:hypothetical protein
MPVSNLKEFVLLSKLRAYLPDEALWSNAETTALKRLESPARRVRRGTDIIVQGRTYDSIFVLAEGFALRYRILVDGRRQACCVGYARMGSSRWPAPESGSPIAPPLRLSQISMTRTSHAVFPNARRLACRAARRESIRAKPCSLPD